MVSVLVTLLIVYIVHKMKKKPATDKARMDFSSTLVTDGDSTIKVPKLTVMMTPTKSLIIWNRQLAMEVDIRQIQLQSCNQIQPMGSHYLVMRFMRVSSNIVAKSLSHSPDNSVNIGM